MAMETVKLRAVHKADLGWLLEHLKTENADGIRQWAGNTLRHPIDAEQLRRHHARLNNGLTDCRGYVAEAGPQRTGYVELFNIKKRGSAFITRMLVLPAFRNQGVGAAMLRQLLKLGFEQLQLHRIELNVYNFNSAAIRCYEKVGFQKEGLLRGITFTGRDYWDAYRMAILEDEWRGR